MRQDSTEQAARAACASQIKLLEADATVGRLTLLVEIGTTISALVCNGNLARRLLCRVWQTMHCRQQEAASLRTVGSSAVQHCP